MPIPEEFLRFWRALDELVSTVTPTRWGAIVTDGRFPAVWDTNYARLDREVGPLHLQQIEEELLPALRRAGAAHVHMVSFFPEEHHALFAEASRRGDSLSWDVVMRCGGPPPVTDDRVQIEELEAGEELWGAVERSFGIFDITEAEVAAQLRRLEVDVLAPSGAKRWFGVRDPTGGPIVALAALLRLKGVGYLDNVATEPPARGRGYASALTAHCVAAAARAGEATYLLVDPEGPIPMYRRLGFIEVGRLASTRRPL